MAIIDGASLKFESFDPMEASGPAAAKQHLTVDSNLGFDTVMALPEKNKEDAIKQNTELSPLVSFVSSQFQRAKDQRRPDECRWMEAYDNFRGQYNDKVQFLEQEKSRAFPKITKTKVVAAWSQILEIISAGGKFPIGVDPAPVPVSLLESVHFDPKSPEEMAKGQEQQPPKTSATIARPSIMESLGVLKETLEPVKDSLKEGPGKTPTSYTFEPAKAAAKDMEMLIQDQLAEADASKSLHSFVFDMCLFGHGIMKGPFAVDKEYPKWDEKGKYVPEFATIADVQYVSIWDAYPDPDARNMEEAEYFIQRHKLSRTQLRALKRRPHFRNESIELAISAGANYIEEDWESSITDSPASGKIERYEALEYWGFIDKDYAERMEVTIPAEFEDVDQIQANVWICNNQILRIVLNPFKPMRIPFFGCPYELNPYSFFGIGVAENMNDTQTIMNGFIRLAVDNAVLSSNIIFEVDETNLVPGQSMSLYPGKIFRKQGGQPGQSIFATKFPNLTQECLAMFDKARQLADEATGMPSYSHGISGILGTGRTASGMSMLMGAAKENIKAVVRNLDGYLFVPLGKSMYAFNMQFNFDKKFLSDVKIVAKGSESLMRNEVRSQKLMQMLQLAGNPMYAPYLKIDYMLRELSSSLDLEADKVVNDPREAGIQAKVMADMAKIMGVQPQQPGGPQGGPGVNDPTQNGNGNIQPGMSPPPGAQGFSGNNKSSGNPQGNPGQQPQGAF